MGWPTAVAMEHGLDRLRRARASADGNNEHRPTVRSSLRGPGEHLTLVSLTPRDESARRWVHHVGQRFVIFIWRKRLMEFEASAQLTNLVA